MRSYAVCKEAAHQFVCVTELAHTAPSHVRAQRLVIALHQVLLQRASRGLAVFRVCARALGDSQLRIDPGGVGAWEVVGGHGYRLVAAITISALTHRNVAPLRCTRGRSARVTRRALGRAMCGR